MHDLRRLLHIRRRFGGSNPISRVHPLFINHFIGALHLENLWRLGRGLLIAI